MNGFKQIQAFYSWVFNNPDKARPTHVSLYLFLWNQANRSNWVEWFKCPYDLAMQGACIGNKGTYYRCLDELVEFKLIKYKKGINNHKAPLINLIQLYNTEPLSEQVSVPLSEPLTVPQSEPLTGLLPVHIYKLITSNHKLVSENIQEWISTHKSKSGSPTKQERIDKFLDWFNLKIEEHKDRKGRYMVLSDTSYNQLKQLRDKYELNDFNFAFEGMIKDGWATENNNITPTHFLRIHNFTKYLEAGQPKTQKEILEEIKRRDS